MAPAGDRPGAPVLERDENMPIEEIRVLEEESAFSDAAAGADEIQPSADGSDAIEAAPAAADLRTLAPQPEVRAERQLTPQSPEAEPAKASLSSSTVAGAACTETDRQQAGMDRAHISATG